jgi:ABC-type antimicrobial peptide transport system permease subunit
MKEVQPPDWINSMIDSLAPNELVEEIHGDLYELYIKDVEEKGPRSANMRYITNGIGFLFKSFFWKKNHNYNPTPMLTSYIKMSRRSLMANKGTTMINIIGLVTGIASALVILSVIRFELSFDSFHTDRDRIYRMVRVTGNDNLEYRSGISYPVPVAMKAEIPNIENMVSVEYFGGANVEVLDAKGNAERKFREEAGAAIVGDTFFDVFDFKNTGMRWLEGDPKTALKEPLSVVLTRTMAKKYFGDESPLGHTMRFQLKHECKVTGVLEDFPSNSDFPFTILVSYSTLPLLAGEQRLNDWFSVNDTHQVFIVLPEKTSQGEMENLIAKVHAAHAPKELYESRHYLLQKLSDLHFDAKFGTFTGRTISKETITGLAIVAAFLLLTGSINYINLATAQSVLRSKEIGLRKVMGSNQTSLMMQFLIETFIVVAISGVVAFILAEVLRFNLQSLLNFKLTYYNFLDPFTIASTLGIITIVTLFAGFYPSVILSRFNPVTALKSKFTTGNVSGITIRKALVVLQFTITQMLVVGTFIVVSQMEHFRNVDMGFNREAVLTARLPKQSANVLSEMQNQLRALPGVSNISLHYTAPSGVRRNRSYADVSLPEGNGLQDKLVFEYYSIDSTYLKLFEIDLLAGRNLKPVDAKTSVLINQTLCKNLQLGTPQEAIGKAIKMGGGELFTVVGVVGDFYSNSLKESVDNAIFFTEDNYSAISVKLDLKNTSISLPESVKAIEKIWSTTYPEYVFNYIFLDDNIATFYAQEQKYSQMFQLFSIVFLVIGCLGLFGLISFVVNRKGKEVAIRKVLGASINNIIMLFSKEYVQLIIISFLIATPVAYYVVNGWLSNFANHIELQWWLFVLPGTIVLAIALLVVSAKSLRAARSNPVDSLKYE